MTLYLTDNTAADEIAAARAAGVVALKLYPAGATTNSDAGVTDIRRPTPTLEAMQREGLLLLVHGEVTDPAVDVFDREAVFIDRVMQPLRRDFPALKVVFEHITTREAAQYVAGADAAPRRRSPRTTCSTTATRCSSAACARTTTACRCSSARAPPGAGAGGHLGQPEVLPRHRQRAARRAPEGAVGAAAPAATPRRRRWSCTPRPSRPPARWTGWRASPASTAPTSTACRATPARSRCEREPWTLPETLPFGDAVIKPLRAGETLNWKLT
jgi:dihydroorotase